MYMVIIIIIITFERMKAGIIYYYIRTYCIWFTTCLLLIRTFNPENEHNLVSTNLLWVPAVHYSHAIKANIQASKRIAEVAITAQARKTFNDRNLTLCSWYGKRLSRRCERSSIVGPWVSVSKELELHPYHEHAWVAHAFVLPSVHDDAVAIHQIGCQTWVGT